MLDFEEEQSPLDIGDPEWLLRSRYKSGRDFLELLKEYVRALPLHVFRPKALSFSGVRVSQEWILDQFLFYENDPILRRIHEVAEDLLAEVRFRAGRFAELPKAGQLRAALGKMLTIHSPAALYRDFYRFAGLTDLLNFHKNRLEWPDVFPFLYLWNAYKGLDRRADIRHVVVDEMQDYTPVQFEVLNILYPCRKTLLGDFGQAMDPTHRCGIEDLLSCFPDAEYTELNRSFRSTEEIMAYAVRISPQPKLIPLERHGEKPFFRHFGSTEEELRFAAASARGFLKSGGASMGILLRNNALAQAFHARLSVSVPEARLLTPQSDTFRKGVSVMALQMAKGLEFDTVLVPEVNAERYGEAADRKLLYVACTRALHRLVLTGTGEPSPFLPE